MKYIYLILSFLLLQELSFSQIPAGARAGGGNMNLGHFYGKIVDGNKKGIDIRKFIFAIRHNWKQDGRTT